MLLFVINFSYCLCMYEYKPYTESIDDIEALDAYLADVNAKRIALEQKLRGYNDDEREQELWQF